MSRYSDSLIQKISHDYSVAIPKTSSKNFSNRKYLVLGAPQGLHSIVCCFVQKCTQVSPIVRTWFIIDHKSNAMLLPLHVCIVITQDIWGSILQKFFSCPKRRNYMMKVFFEIFKFDSLIKLCHKHQDLRQLIQNLPSLVIFIFNEKFSSYVQCNQSFYR